MKKIAVCLPSYNEATNIENMTRVVDKGLSEYKEKGYEVIIINIDNSSEDSTSEMFKSVETICDRLSILTKKPGKGINLLTFFQYCFDNKIDYAITIDSDVKSITSDWIYKYLNPLIEGFDYVVPVYKRMRYEGSTTNHFAYPIISIIGGQQIRQPIAGDFSFNRKFIDLVVAYDYNDSIEKYGIDIFMTLIACSNNLKIQQIILDKKIHNPSFTKIEKMFEEVLDGFLYTWKQIYKSDYIFPLQNISFNENEICILRDRNFSHKKNAKVLFNKYKKVFPTIQKNEIEYEWIEELYNILTKPEKIDDKAKNKIKALFIVRATSFWLDSETISAKHCEYKIYNQLNNLNEKIKEKSK